MYINELCDKRAGELGMFSQATNGDVLSPFVLNWQGRQWFKDKYIEDVLINTKTQDFERVNDTY